MSLQSKLNNKVQESWFSDCIETLTKSASQEGFFKASQEIAPMIDDIPDEQVIEITFPYGKSTCTVGQLKATVSQVIETRNRNQEHYDAAIEFSNANIKIDPNQRNTLPECIEYLANGAIDGTKLHLTPDFVGHSFSFALTREVDGKEKLVMHGGIILHGYEQTFSVELSPPSGPHYSIHT